MMRERKRGGGSPGSAVPTIPCTNHKYMFYSTQASACNNEILEATTGELLVNFNSNVHNSLGTPHIRANRITTFWWKFM